MADNVAITPGTGTTIATDDVGGVQYQRVKPAFGADGSATDVDASHPLPVVVGDATAQANVLAGDSGQNAQLVTGARKEVSFSTTTAQAVAVTDVSNYRWVSVQITGQGTNSTIAFQGSNDNSTWVSVPLMTSTSTAGPVVQSTTATGILHGPVFYRYFRLNVTGISAGTTAGVVEFYSMPVAMQGYGVDTELPAAAALSDTAGNPTTPTVGAANLYFDGTNWKRATLGGGGLPVAGDYKEVSFTVNANSAFAVTDCAFYRWVSVQFTSFTWNGRVDFYGSNDNSTWVLMPLVPVTNANPAVPVTNATAAGIWSGPLPFRYFRLVGATGGSGTAPGVIEFFANAPTTNTVDTELPAAASPIDSSATPTAPAVYGYGMAYNSSLAAWDRRRTANSANATTGTGVPAAGMMGFDGTNWRRAKVDANGVQAVSVDTGTLLDRIEQLELVLRQLLAGAAGQVPDSAGRTRASVDTFASGAILPTVTTVSTVSTVTKLSQLGVMGLPAEQFVYHNPAALALRDRIQVS